VGAQGNVATMRPPVWAAPTATYIICTNPRSGSWLLSEGLASTAVAGNPREWFNVMEEQQYRARWRMDHASDLSHAQYLRLARADSVTRNGVSGIKLHYYQLAEFLAKMAVTENHAGLTAGQLMAKLFPKARYLWLRRRDKARQAISLYLASSTNEWWAIDGLAPDRRRAGNADPAFDLHAIARMESALTTSDSRWQSYFQDNGIEPFVVYYEDLAADYVAVVQAVLKWLGAPDPDSIVAPPPRLRRQSTARNEEWLTLYAAFKSGGGDLAQDSPPPGSAAPLFEGLNKPFDTVPAAWRQWVAQSKVRKIRDDEIVGVLVNNGYGRAAARAEVRRTTSDPYVLGAALTQRRLGKRASLLNAIGQMARLASQPIAVERRTQLSREEFRDRYYAANRPVVIQGLMADWPAMKAWTPDYLKRVCGDQTIEVMTGRDADPRYEMNPRKHRTELRFANYVDMVYSGKATNDYDMVASNGFFQRPGTQRLLQDFAAFPEYLKPIVAGRQCALWFGPAGTVTPLHHATNNILLAQVVGRKRYLLVPASQWQCVYNRAGVFSDVDCENPDLLRHPRFRDATIIDIVVEPGEALFMPVGWWRHVRALEVSMTISFTNFLFPNHFTWEE
jgi:LPS sulfotransferase NodH